MVMMVGCWLLELYNLTRFKVLEDEQGYSYDESNGHDGWLVIVCCWNFRTWQHLRSQRIRRVKVTTKTMVMMVGCLVIGSWGFTSWKHIRSHQNEYKLVTVCTQGDFILLPHWEIRLPAPCPNILFG